MAETQATAQGPTPQPATVEQWEAVVEKVQAAHGEFNAAINKILETPEQHNASEGIAEAVRLLSELTDAIRHLSQLRGASGEPLAEISNAISALESQKSNIEALQLQLQNGRMTPAEARAQLAGLQSAVNGAVSYANEVSHTASAELKSDVYAEKYFEEYAAKNRELMHQASMGWDDGYENWQRAQDAKAQIVNDYIEEAMKTPEGQADMAERARVAGQRVREAEGKAPQDPDSKSNRRENSVNAFMRAFGVRMTAEQTYRMANDPEMKPTIDAFKQEMLENVEIRNSIIRDTNKWRARNNMPLMTETSLEEALEVISKYTPQQIDEISARAREKAANKQDLTAEERQVSDIKALQHTAMEALKRQYPDMSMNEMMRAVLKKQGVSEAEIEKQITYIAEKYPQRISPEELQEKSGALYNRFKEEQITKIESEQGINKKQAEEIFANLKPKDNAVLLSQWFDANKIIVSGDKIYDMGYGPQLPTPQELEAMKAASAQTEETTKKLAIESEIVTATANAPTAENPKQPPAKPIPPETVVATTSEAPLAAVIPPIDTANQPAPKLAKTVQPETATAIKVEPPLAAPVAILAAPAVIEVAKAPAVEVVQPVQPITVAAAPEPQSATTFTPDQKTAAAQPATPSDERIDIQAAMPKLDKFVADRGTPLSPAELLHVIERALGYAPTVDDITFRGGIGIALGGKEVLWGNDADSLEVPSSLTEMIRANYDMMVSLIKARETEIESPAPTEEKISSVQPNLSPEAAAAARAAGLTASSAGTSQAQKGTAQPQQIAVAKPDELAAGGVSL